MLLRIAGLRREIVTQTATHRPPAELFSTGTSWLTRAIFVSTFLHVIVAVVWWQLRAPDDDTTRTTVDIELAPPPPKVEALPEEVAKAPQSAPAAQQTGGTENEPEDDGLGPIDAGVDAPVDAPIDAPPKKRKRPDAALVAESTDDAGDDAGSAQVLAVDPGLIDAGVELGGDAGLVAATESGSGVGSGVGTGSGEGSGVAAATETGSGSGTPGMDNQPAVAGAPTSAGTAANLLAYFPAGHQVTALIRFDRLRKTEWAAPAERLFKPMPDYKVLFGSRDAGVAEKFDTLVISSPRPEDATATTLVVRSSLTRPKLRDYLANPATPITWTVAKGGMFGKRTGKLFNGDKRVLLSPWRNWIVLAHPDDLPGLTGMSKGAIDTVETKAALPPWLQTIRTIEAESGDDKDKGPALVLTLAGPGHRYDIPDVGLGVTSLPSPQRISLAMELVDQGGWFIRGNIVFATEADAKEFEQTVRDVQQKIVDSRILSALLKRQHALNAVKNLSVARTEARVSYATSVSIADMRAVMAAAAATLDQYFAGQQQPP
jgi:hypothetical protein